MKKPNYVGQKEFIESLLRIKCIIQEKHEYNEFNTITLKFIYKNDVCDNVITELSLSKHNPTKESFKLIADIKILKFKITQILIVGDKNKVINWIDHHSDENHSIKYLTEIYRDLDFHYGER